MSHAFKMNNEVCFKEEQSSKKEKMECLLKHYFEHCFPSLKVRVK